MLTSSARAGRMRRGRAFRAPAALLDHQPEEYASERRHGDIAGAERRRLREAVAVRQKNQRDVTVWQRQHERRGRVRLEAVLPDDGFAVVSLYEPAQAVRQK